MEHQLASQVSLLWFSPKPHACPDACKAWVDPWEEPNPGPGPGTLQVGQMGKGCLQCPSCCGSCPSCFAGAEGQTRGPRCSCSSCNRSSKAVQELQQLVLSGLPEHVAALSPEFWVVAWTDLLERVEWGILCCCICPVPEKGATWSSITGVR